MSNITTCIQFYNLVNWDDNNDEVSIESKH